MSLHYGDKNGREWVVIPVTRSEFNATLQDIKRPLETVIAQEGLTEYYTPTVNQYEGPKLIGVKIDLSLPHNLVYTGFDADIKPVVGKHEKRDRIWDRLLFNSGGRDNSQDDDDGLTRFIVTGLRPYQCEMVMVKRELEL